MGARGIFRGLNLLLFRCCRAFFDACLRSSREGREAPPGRSASSCGQALNRLGEPSASALARFNVKAKGVD